MVVSIHAPQGGDDAQAHINYLRRELEAVSDGDLDDGQKRKLRIISRFVAVLLERD